MQNQIHWHKDGRDGWFADMPANEKGNVEATIVAVKASGEPLVMLQVCYQPPQGDGGMKPVDLEAVKRDCPAALTPILKRAIAWIEALAASDS